MAEAGRDPDAQVLLTERRRRGPPAWGVLLFLSLLAGMILLNRWTTSGGQPVRWIENDLNAALAQAKAEGKRLFLYIYDANDPFHTRNERELFSQRWVRDPLALAVCCRVRADVNDLVAMKYGYQGTPLFILFKEDGREALRTQGAVDERQFSTYIGNPLLGDKRR